MKKSSIFKLLIFVMSLLIAFSSDSPIVICLGDDGHIGIKMDVRPSKTPLPLQLAENVESACQLFNLPTEQMVNENCFDVLIYNGSFIDDAGNSAKRILGKRHYSPVPLVFTGNNGLQILKFKKPPNRSPFMNPSLDNPIKTVVLLI